MHMQGAILCRDVCGYYDATWREIGRGFPFSTAAAYSGSGPRRDALQKSVLTMSLKLWIHAATVLSCTYLEQGIIARASYLLDS